MCASISFRNKNGDTDGRLHKVPSLEIRIPCFDVKSNLSYHHTTRKKHTTTNSDSNPGLWRVPSKRSNNYTIPSPFDKQTISLDSNPDFDMKLTI